MSKELLFSVTKSDFDVSFFRCGGAGGQHRDKTSNGCRVTHRESGVSRECTQFREQSANKKTAFQRLAKSPEFNAWLSAKAREMRIDHEAVQAEVDRAMAQENLSIEFGPFDE